ncbi:MAG: 6-carboxytetrahydropterin synthase QueD [Candidatus Levybacteria bacterium CG_4_9_14_0_2_um_filter_35_21]|nr:MAG: 6-carboxytetrahydropterin synthase QueD [Candidatus Levybacteria bacterium CG_4_9_14_0_2_um_filter_35_21]
MLITKEFRFDAAHQLLNYNGPCANLHGHTYKLQVSVAGIVQKSGMVMDFGDLKNIVNEKVISKLDHTFINKIIIQSTAENITLWIWNQLEEFLPLQKITLWETPTSFVEYVKSENK